MRSITLALQPTTRFPVPYSDGYSVYSALLNILSDSDETLIEKIHDTSQNSIHTSGLSGNFKSSSRDFHKTVAPNENYTVTIGITDQAHEEVFNAFVKEFIMEDTPITLTHGELTVSECDTGKNTHEGLLRNASESGVQRITVQFETPTCINESGEVTTMFPHRRAVFHSVLEKWNQTCSPEQELSISDTDLNQNLIEIPEYGSLDSHKVVVNRVQDDSDDHARNIFRQGFTGKCTYQFKNASESFRNAVTALASFSEFSGVGSAVARGCGNVTVTTN